MHVPTEAESTRNDSSQASSTAGAPLRVVRSSDLFGEQREIVIRHRDEDYRLRLTSSNKLILTK
ncbi:hemin uptake protein HemP [Humitalea rosea]|uniref:Hemin uptake protein HemP n=1 Tax=Humitalea rosea TaxID=990373 RepID=A0A2W7IIN5_9PROT|nr:hemin uptake protein HemP [Humitalea rosea]PZW46513.1 hemin uptake protein HemP [Humitalea rosea]